MQISLQKRHHGLTIGAMSSGRVFRFGPTAERRPNHLFVFLHGCGATARSMIPIAFKFQARFPSAALVGFSQGGTVALEAVKAPGIAGAVVAFSSRYAKTPARNSRIASRIHLVHGEFDSVVSRVYAERAARVLAGLHVPVTLDIVEDLGHALSHRAISLGSLRLLQGIYEGRRHTLH